MSKQKPLRTLSKIFLKVEELLAICFLATSIHFFITFFSPTNSIQLFELEKGPSKIVVLSTCTLIGGYSWYCLNNIDHIKKD